MTDRHHAEDLVGCLYLLFTRLFTVYAIVYCLHLFTRVMAGARPKSEPSTSPLKYDDKLLNMITLSVANGGPGVARVNIINNK